MKSCLLTYKKTFATKFTEEQRRLIGISSFLDPRWKSLSFLEELEKEEINAELIKDFWNTWNGENYLKHLLLQRDNSCTPLSLLEKMPKLNEEVGNFMLSLINESDSVAIDDNVNT